MNRAWISLGANLGDSVKNLEKALRLLDDGTEIFLDARSPFYRTKAVDFTDQPDFVNLCARVRTVKTPESLLERLLLIQAALGQGGKAFPFAPRLMDLDLILFEDRVIHTDALILPHPRMHLRRFVLKPLCDLDPGLVHPVLGVSVSRLLEKIPEKLQKIQRIP